MTQFFQDEQLIKAWLKEYNVKRFTLKPNSKYGFIVDVQENVVIGHGNLKFLPIKFGCIEGSFNLFNHRSIKNFSGAPSKVQGNFNWERTGITGLKGSPKIVGKSYSVAGNMLTSLNGCPKEINGYFDCSGNRLRTLLGGPEITKGSYRAAKNNLKNLEGCALKIDGFLNCEHNPIENFHYLPDTMAGDLKFTINDKIAQYEGKSFKEIEALNLQFKEKNNLDRQLADYADPDIHGPVFKL